jgi:Ca2+-binding EF-hand superfamily protein
MRLLACTLLCLSLGLLLTADGAAGQDEPKQKGDEPKKKGPAMLAELSKLSAEDFIKRLDKNKDGYLSKEEVQAFPRLSDNFSRFDLDGNGLLDKKEVERMLTEVRKRLGQAAGPASKADVERRVDEILKRLDTDKDGKVSRAEARGPLAEIFDRLDTNKDGYLDRTELRRFAERMAAQGGPPGKGDGRPGPAANRPDFDALDKNADGRLTRDELKGTPYADHFDEIDTNKDGKIDRKEFEAYLKKREEKKNP